MGSAATTSANNPLTPPVVVEVAKPDEQTTTPTKYMYITSWNGDPKLFVHPPAQLPATRITKSNSQCKDSVSDTCMLCDAKFTTTFRRHHCRACGILICAPCSKKEWVTLDGKRRRFCTNDNQIQIYAGQFPFPDRCAEKFPRCTSCL